MNRRWFVEIDGRAQGPFSQSQVQDLARLKRINPMTRIFSEGDVRWRLMNEFDEFKIVPESSSSVQSREWVVLKRKTLKEAELSQNKFDQIGPFTVDEIIEQIKTGDLSYNDYAWKKGFQRWAKLEALPDFNFTVKAPLPSVPDAPPVAIAFLNEPKLDIDPEEQNELDHFTVTNSKPLKRSVETSVKEKPVGGSKKSVRAFEAEINKQTEDKKLESSQPHVAIENSDSDITVTPGISRGRKVFRVALATVATGVVTALAYNFINENYGPVAPTETTPQTSSVAVAPASPEAKPEAKVAANVEPITDVAQEIPVAKPPSELPQKASNASPKQVYSKADYEMPKNPRIDFDVIRPDSTGQVILSTNAPVDHPIEIKITGKSGQILRYASYSQTVKVRRQGGEVPSIQLSTMKLPFGTYTVEAKFADQAKQKTFFYGVRDAKFQKSLDAHLKKISTEQIAEKKMVFYFLRELETRAKKLETQRAKAAKSKAGWAKAYKDWKKDLLKVTATTFSPLRKMSNRDIAYPEVITKAKELSQQLLKQGEELNSAIVQNRALASSGMGPILSAIRDFKKEVSLLSRY